MKKQNNFLSGLLERYDMGSTNLKTCICPACGQVFLFDPKDLHVVDFHGMKYTLCSNDCYSEVMKLMKEHNYEKIKDIFRI